jgi:hypothetical protein
MKVFDELQTHGLKDIGGVGGREVELYGNGINETTVTKDERFPGFCVPS